VKEERKIFSTMKNKIQLRVARHKPNGEYNFSSEVYLCVFIEFSGMMKNEKNIHELLQPLWYVEWKQHKKEREKEN
jgi:hypothetical protein